MAMLTRPLGASIVRKSRYRGIADEDSGAGRRRTRTRARVETEAEFARGKNLVRPWERRHRRRCRVHSHGCRRRGRERSAGRKNSAGFDRRRPGIATGERANGCVPATKLGCCWSLPTSRAAGRRSEEHTSELQSHHDLVCRLLLEKKT